jgi:threonine dehydrogenase-like Zn-dependent dehydrogenase
VNVDDFASAADRARAVRELTGGGGHVVAELVGHPAVIPEGLAMARVEGRYLMIGNIGGDDTLAFNPAWLVHFNRRIVGVGGYQAWALKRGLELLRRTRDRYPYASVLSHRFPIEEINEAFAQAAAGKTIRTALINAKEPR